MRTERLTAGSEPMWLYTL